MINRKRNRIQMIKKLIGVLVVALGVVGCNQKENAGNVVGDDVDQQSEFKSYLKIKRISADDQSRYDRLFSEYQRRSDLANAIYDTNQLDGDLINAEVEEFRKELLISRYFEEYLSNAVTDEGIRNYYRENIELYKSKKVKISHILFRIDDRMTEIERQVVLTKAMDTHGRIIQGDDFSELAMQTSEDKVSAKKGGDLGWINEGAITKGFSEKVFSMKKGDMSEPFLTDYGFHIIKITEGIQDITKPLETVKGDIRYQLRNESKKAEMRRLLDSLNGEQQP